MEIREIINKHQHLVTGTMVAMFAVAGVWIWFSSHADSQLTAPHPNAPPAYYTNDEGTTLFVLRNDHPTPFELYDKQAVRAYVFTSGHQKWVQYLEMDDPKSSTPLVRRPNDSNWLSKTAPGADAICKPVSPDGGAPSPVLPGGIVK
jgi:hypothetical protein